MQYDAVEFLKSLFRTPEPTLLEPTLLEPTLTDLTGDWLVLWDERAAIMEYDGGLPREQAEHLALVEITAQMRNHTTGRGEARGTITRGKRP
jgi:hypothetical protein